MQASTDFLMALSLKLTEIAKSTSDLETESELYEFIEKIDETIENLTK
ncbi:hypothetical protein ACTT1L_16700 [Bacillus sp. FH]|nr:hypothetical protein [Bacillus cereus]MDA4083828.1 hypothetical protein [Bacillus cereus]